MRRAFVCVKCNRRVFLRDGEDLPGLVLGCNEHGPMVRQENRPYRGVSTEPPAGSGVPVAGVSVDGVLLGSK